MIAVEPEGNNEAVIYYSQG